MNYQELIIKTLKKHGAKGEITATTAFKDMGLDSLDLMDMVVQIEEQLSIRVPDEELENLVTVQDLVTMIERLKK